MQRIIKVGFLRFLFQIVCILFGFILFLISLDIDTTITVPDTIAQWYWDFGGQGASTLQNPSNVYQNPGNYNPCRNKWK